MFSLFVIFLRYICLLRSDFIWLTLFLNPNLKLLNWELLRELIQVLWLLSETLDLLGRNSSGAKFFQKLVELKGWLRRAVKTKHLLWLGLEKIDYLAKITSRSS